MSDQAAAQNYRQEILWQDRTHPEGYQPTLKMLTYPDGKRSLELNVFGTVSVMPFTRAENSIEDIAPAFDLDAAIVAYRKYMGSQDGIFMPKDPVAHRATWTIGFRHGQRSRDSASLKQNEILNDRINYEWRDGALYVCKREHEKHEPCDYVHYVPAETTPKAAVGRAKMLLNRIRSIAFDTGGEAMLAIRKLTDEMFEVLHGFEPGVRSTETLPYGPLDELVRELYFALVNVEQVAPGYDWNADPLKLTLAHGELFHKVEALVLARPKPSDLAVKHTDESVSADLSSTARERVQARIVELEAEVKSANALFVKHSREYQERIAELEAARNQDRNTHEAIQSLLTEENVALKAEVDRRVRANIELQGQLREKLFP